MARRQGLDWLRIHDYVACCVPFGLFLGRLANFINAELWGRETDLPWGIVFPNGGEVARHPSQLYEAGLEGVLLFAILWYLFWRTRARYQPGKLVGAFILVYGISRFLVEMVRQPDAGLEHLAWGLSMGQTLSLPMILGGLYLVLTAGSARSGCGPSRPMNPLEERLKRRIADEGPISVADYMAEANAHYYATRDPFGAAGDFTTAPEISQMFGELAGIWLADLWQRAGRPAGALYVELGPGRGTLAADALRAMRGAGLEPPVELVETSPVLRLAQAERLSARWHDDLSTLPDTGPLLVIANEFFDALPVRQLDAQGRERTIAWADGRFVARGEVETETSPHVARYRPRPRPPARRAGRRGPDRRLRPRPAGPGRHASGGVAPCLRRSVRGAGRARPHRPCRFRGAGRGGAGRPRPRAGDAGRVAEGDGDRPARRRARRSGAGTGGGDRRRARPADRGGTDGAAVQGDGAGRARLAGAGGV